jgi:hypothetical protein
MVSPDHQDSFIKYRFVTALMTLTVFTTLMFFESSAMPVPISSTLLVHS